MNRSRAMSMRDRGRAHTERLRPRLYKLPLDLLTTILDYLNYEEILCLCEDPKFPIEILLRRHLVKEYDTPILDYIVFRDWVFPSAIKRLIALIEDWDVGNEKTDRPLVTALNVKRISLCTIFLEAGARVNFAETTVVSQEILSRYIREQGIQGPREDTITRILRLGGGRHEVVRTPLEPIHIAVFTGNLTGSSNLEIIKLLLDHGANPNAHAGLFGTPLHLTTNNAVIKLLLANGADVNARDGLGATPLFEAIRMNDFNSFATLVKAGADINVLNHQNVTPINFAIELGHSRIMNLLMDAGCDISGQSGGVPSLYVAAGLGQQVAVQSLIKKGADVAIRYDDSTALHGTEDPSTASTLLAYGADINAKDRNGTTPFMLATQSNNYRLMEVYLMADADVSPSHLQENETLSWLADNGLYHLQRLLVSRCDLRLSVEESETILRNAIHDKFEAIAFLLIETFPHLVTDEYALWEAARLSSPRLVQKIIDLRQKVEAEDRGFIDGLFGAIDLAREDVVKILPQALISPVNLGKIVNLPLFVLIVGTHDALQEIEKMSKEHPTHQWMSIRENEPTDVSIEKSLSMLQTLIDHGADISNAEYEGMGILHCAAWRNSEPLMRALLAAGANPLFKDARGYTAAYWAARLSHFEMEKILRLAEADALAKQEVEEGRSDGVEAQP